jgi:hypothetical protein
VLGKVKCPDEEEEEGAGGGAAAAGAGAVQSIRSIQEFCEQNGLEKYVEVMRDNEVDLGTLEACARIH